MASVFSCLVKSDYFLLCIITPFSLVCIYGVALPSEGHKTLSVPGVVEEADQVSRTVEGEGVVLGLV